MNYCERSPRGSTGWCAAADALGRLGGDEFVVISEELSLEVGPELIAERLLDALKEPFKLGAGNETRVTVTASIGIAAGDHASAEELLREADIAMYRAKWDGKNRHVVFETGMQDTVQNRMELEMDLREALDNDEFFLAYQPTLDLHDMSPTGVEALIRWKHPVRGIVQPDDFIPLLEETGLIVEVGKWVLRGGLCSGRGMASGGISDRDGRQRLRTPARHRSGRRPTSKKRSPTAAWTREALTIEITETTLMRNIEETARRLVAIKAARRADRDRRLRHRVLLSRSPATVPRRRAEDRPVVHPGTEGQPGGRDADPHPRAARQVAVDRDLRRGHRAAARALPAQRRGLRLRAGLPVRPAPRRGRHREVPPELGARTPLPLWRKRRGTRRPVTGEWARR